VSAMGSTIRQRLHDQAMHAYVDWRELCVVVQAAYERWARTPASQAGLAFREYQDALDREERSSLEYALLVGWLLQ
jgi:hypothetical protein